MAKKLCSLLLLFHCLFDTGLATAATIEEVQIQNVISEIYDKPNSKVVTNPISVKDNFAIADWIQGNRGGRALLKRTSNKWQIMACGGDGFKDINNLNAACIPNETAKSLLLELNRLEKSVDAHRLHLFSIYGTKDDSKSMEHHHHH